jgi:hypothetical protein
MEGDRIPDSDRIARYCKASTIDDGQIQASAFQPKLNGDALSANWLEFLACASYSSEINELRKLYAGKFTVGRRSRIAILNVGAVRGKVSLESEDHRDLGVLHWPESYRNKGGEDVTDESHSVVLGFRHDDMLIAELILSTILDSVPAIETP